ncbi:MAG: DUF1643 domain-containing protein [Candidatus Halichondribacter symbioticus]
MPNTVEISYPDGNRLSIFVYSSRLNPIYRYLLTRTLDITNLDDDLLMFVMLNPSTSTPQDNDPTVARCEERARRNGFNKFCVTNLFAFITPYPRVLKRAHNPNDPNAIIGIENDRIIQEQAQIAHTIVCAWGANVNDSRLTGRDGDVKRMLRETAGDRLHYFGLTGKERQPKHPLPLDYEQDFEPWNF